MSGKKRGFQSFDDAAEMLQKAFGAKSHQNPPTPSKPQTKAAPPKAEASPFAEIEQAMLRKADAQKGSQMQNAFGENSSSNLPPPPKPRTKTEPAKAKPHADVEAARVRRAEAPKGGQKKKQPVKTKGTAKGAPQKKSGKGRATQIVVKIRGAKAILREHKKNEQWTMEGNAKPAEETASDPNAARKEAFQRIREIVGSRSAAIEERPTSVSKATATQIESAIARGGGDFAAAPEPDLDNGFIVGFDFGTSSLKLAVRQPYKAGTNIAFMPVPGELRSGGHDHLWQTALWVDPRTLVFSLFPQPGMEILEGFKTGIIGGHGGQRVRQDLPVTRSEAAIAYIALQIAYFFGWYAKTRPLAAGGDHFLSINIGIPVAAHDDAKSFKTFKHIIWAARELVAYAEHLTLDDVRQAHQSSMPDLPPGWQLIPELTAAIAGYTSEPTSLEGAHVLIDVGASTLDIVAFNHIRQERNAVISAGVELLGSAALDIARSEGIDDEDFRWCCDRQFQSVFGDACRPSRGSNGFSPALRSRDVQLITTGGGCASTLHAAFIEDKNRPQILGTLTSKRPKPPEPSTGSISDPSRLLLAYGLTRDIPELLELKLPSQVPDIKPPQAPTIGFISKDDV